MSPIETLSLRAKVLDFRLTPTGKSKYRVTRDGILGGGYHGTIESCLAFLDGWALSKVYPHDSR